MVEIMKRFLNKRLLLVLLLVGIGGFVAWNRFKPKAPPQTVTPSFQTLTKTLDVSGTVDAKEKATLHYPAAALLSWLPVSENQPVQKWQALAKLDTRTLEKQLQQDLNSFAKQFRGHDQTLDTADFYGSAGISQEMKRIVESSSFDLQSSALQVEIRDLAIKLSTLRSPIEGIIADMSVDQAGAFVGPTDYIQVINPKTVYFAAVVDEVDIATVKQHQTATLTLDAYEDSELTTTVTDIDFVPSTSKNGGTGYKVSLSLLPQPELTYRLGMGGTVKILLDKKENVLALPIDTVIFREDGQYVDVYKNGTVVRQKIETGLETDDYIEIKSGISEHDAVVLPQASS